ncbi:hypothetical protein FQA39_LY06003 [Lamprigera yunnana]|nr:hypothetical protein FQA39_LY06003 [Lamprigera yunnana]
MWKLCIWIYFFCIYFGPLKTQKTHIYEKCHPFPDKERRNFTNDDAFFTLHTRQNREGINITNTTAYDIPNRKTVLLIPHGHQNTTSYFLNFTDAYLHNKEINVIQTHTNHIIHQRPRVYVEPLGNRISQLLVFLKNERKIELGNIHLIGIGLGSHIAGIAANTTNVNAGTTSDPKIGRVSALSPSNTDCYSIRTLRTTDALIVDSYESSDKGYKGEIGTITFYPNGGKVQHLCPECCTKEAYYCNAIRSVWLYIYTIGINIEATICDSYEQFLEMRCSSKHPSFGDAYDGANRGKAYLWIYCTGLQKCISTN